MCACVCVRVRVCVREYVCMLVTMARGVGVCDVKEWILLKGCAVPMPGAMGSRLREAARVYKGRDALLSEDDVGEQRMYDTMLMGA